MASTNWFGITLALLAPSLAHAADIPADIDIPVRITKDIKDNNAEVPYEITEDVRDKAGVVLIPKGSTGRGRVVQYKSPAIWGGPGKTEVSLDNVTLPDGRTLTATAKATKYGSDARIASVLLLGTSLFGFITKGGSGKVGSTTNLKFRTN